MGEKWAYCDKCRSVCLRNGFTKPKWLEGVLQKGRPRFLCKNHGKDYNFSVIKKCNAIADEVKRDAITFYDDEVLHYKKEYSIRELTAEFKKLKGKKPGSNKTIEYKISVTSMWKLIDAHIKKQQEMKNRQVKYGRPFRS